MKDLITFIKVIHQPAGFKKPEHVKPRPTLRVGKGLNAKGNKLRNSGSLAHITNTLPITC